MSVGEQDVVEISASAQQDEDIERIFAALAAPFEPEEVKIREQAGRNLHYITARTAMNRLDEVLGPQNWWDEFPHIGENSVMCKLTIRLPNGLLLSKHDAGGYAGMKDPGDDDKSGFADAFKRACVKFGIGRYLYRDGVPFFVRERLRESGHDVVALNASRSEPSRGPSPPPRRSAEAAPREPSRASRNDRDDDRAPNTGRGLYAWVKDQDDRYDYGLLKHLNAWAKRQQFPELMTSYSAEQIAQAYSEGCRLVQYLHQQGQTSLEGY